MILLPLSVVFGLVDISAQLTEEDGDEGRRLEQLLEHVAVDGLDGLVQLAVVVVNQPLEHRVLVAEVAWKEREMNYSNFPPFLVFSNFGKHRNINSSSLSAYFGKQ